MRRTRRAGALDWVRMARSSLLLLVVLASVVPGAGTAVAHEEKRVGPLALEAGWLQEPAYAGLPNAVEVTLNRGNAPVGKASLTVEVAFGARRRRPHRAPAAGPGAGRAGRVPGIRHPHPAGDLQLRRDR